MTTNRLKQFAIMLFAIPLLAVMAFKVTPVHVSAVAADDAAATFKAKCSACHTATASKYFDATLPDAELVQAILKGKKGEKPPYMPAFEAKGITEADAKALVTYMKSLRTPAN
jgi:mono/diheme cytochrome c family protein